MSECRHGPHNVVLRATGAWYDLTITCRLCNQVTQHTRTWASEEACEQVESFRAATSNMTENTLAGAKNVTDDVEVRDE